MIRPLLFLVSSLTALFCCEVYLRLNTSVDRGQNLTVLGARLRPYVLPLQSLERTIKLYRSSNPRLVAVEDIGWEPQKNTLSSDGLYEYGTLGERITDGQKTSTESPFVIALFGDSFTHGDDVQSSEAWSALLERGLNNQGLSTTVLNFGVSGYGMDQALFRLQKLRTKLAPDLIIFGFQPENVLRNLNLISAFYFGSENPFPFSKPRFVVSENGELTLINRESPSVDALFKIMSNITLWPLVKKEFFYEKENYKRRWWLHSRLLAFIDAAVYVFSAEDRLAAVYEKEHEGYRIAEHVLAEFSQVAEELNADFLVLAIPTKSDIVKMASGKTVAYGSLLDAYSERYRVVDPTTQLLAKVEREGIDSLYKSHFTVEGNREISQILTTHILNTYRGRGS